MPFKEDFYQVSHLVNFMCSKDLLIPAKYNTKNHQKNKQNITFFRKSLQTTSLVTWNSAEGILLIFNLDFLRYSNVCIIIKKKNKETFVKTIKPDNVLDSNTRPEKMQNSRVVRFGFELCLLASLLAKAVG